jgi:hypothetical protein
MFTSAVVSIVVRNTIFRKAPPSVVSGYDKRSINLNKVVATFEKHIFLIWYRHPNSEAGNDAIQNVQSESKHGFLFCGNYILKYW